jgi:hypothetical protein
MPSLFYFGGCELGFMAKNRVVAKIESVHGKCPVYEGGEKIVMENGVINLAETDAVCLQLLSTLIHEYMAKQHADYWQSFGGFDYSKEKTKCPRAGPPHGEGYVIVNFESTPVEK